MDQNSAGIKGDLLYKIFGEFKNYLSDVSDMQTDLYFHGGIADVDKAECALIDEGNAGVHSHDHSVHKEHGERKNIAPADILLKTADALNITEHYHISGDREKELLPWIFYSVKLNPENEKTYVIGGYWLSFRLKKIQEGIAFLREGLSNNPGSCDINMTLGEIYLTLLKDYPEAIVYLEKAKELGGARRIDKYNTRGIYTFLADAYAKTGSPEKSIALYEELLKLFPGDKPITEKLVYFEGLKSEAKK